jgi:hypothetical protein
MNTGRVVTQLRVTPAPTAIRLTSPASGPLIESFHDIRPTLHRSSRREGTLWDGQARETTYQQKVTLEYDLPRPDRALRRAGSITCRRGVKGPRSPSSMMATMISKSRFRHCTQVRSRFRVLPFLGR